MSRRRRDDRARRRGFRPEGDGLLESRRLLAAPVIHLAYGGKIAEVRDSTLARFNIIIDGGGVVRAQPMKGGKIKIIVDGSGPTSELSINPLLYVPEKKGLAHHFPTRQATAGHYLQVGEIDITSGQIGQILGYQTAILSGPINIPGTTSVDRIAFYSYQPGASITTGGDLNTLDAYTDINLSGGPGISIGRDLNWLFVAGNLNLTDGSSFIVGRDEGTFAQPAKGSDTGGQGATIVGNMTVGTGSQFVITRALEAPFVVNGNLSGASNITVGFGATSFIVRGAVTA